MMYGDTHYTCGNFTGPTLEYGCPEEQDCCSWATVSQFHLGTYGVSLPYCVSICEGDESVGSGLAFCGETNNVPIHEGVCYESTVECWPGSGFFVCDESSCPDCVDDPMGIFDAVGGCDTIINTWGMACDAEISSQTVGDVCIASCYDCEGG
tara:strand:- start:125 stop:580 length:456 start_codon:yes stop_codon:yes gene_type:complete